MKTVDFDGAKDYALKRLEEELAPDLTYHNFEHTTNYVLAAVERLARAEGVEGEDLLLLQTAAYYHDIGYIRQSHDHEEAGVEIVRQVLPRFGYSQDQIDTISGIIMATRMPQSPQTLLEKIMADADLDVLGTDDFFSTSYGLRQELANAGEESSDFEWYQYQLEFLQSHQYFTEAARRARVEGKQRNAEAVRKLIAELKERS